MPVSPDTLPRMTPEEYLAYEHSQEIRHELVDGYLYAMTGASRRHEEIALNLAAALHAHLRGKPCRAYKGDLKIRVGADFHYPDVFVRCGEPAADGDPYAASDPVLVAEVLSPSTQRYDRGDKRLACWSLPSMREYVLIAQDRRHVEVTRLGEPESIVLTRDEDSLTLDSIGFSMALADLYE